MNQNSVSCMTVSEEILNQRRKRKTSFYLNPSLHCPFEDPRVRLGCVYFAGLELKFQRNFYLQNVLKVGLVMR